MNINMHGQPCVGILLKDSTEDGNTVRFHTCKPLFLEKRYIKYLEPYTSNICLISPYYNQSEMHIIIQTLDGIILPGGYTNIYSIVDTCKQESLYTKAVRTIMLEARLINKSGKLLPVYGICLGFEAMIAVESESDIIQMTKACLNFNASLIFKKDPTYSLTFSHFDISLLKTLASVSMTFNNHEYSIDANKFINSGASKLYDIVCVSESEDSKTTFISVIEGNEYPFIGVQFHPEVGVNSYFNAESGLNPIVDINTQKLAHSLMYNFIELAKVNCHTIETPYTLISMFPYEEITVTTNGEIGYLWNHLPKIKKL